MTRHSVNCWRRSEGRAFGLSTLADISEGAPLARWLPIILVLLAAGCTRQRESGRLLASVNGSQLYMRDVGAHVDTNSAYAVRNYVSNWVNEQLLYGEAQKQGLNDSPEFDERVKGFSRQLAITMLLNERVYKVPANLTPEEISNYYDAHRGELLVAGELVCVNLAAFDKRRFAVAFRNALVSGAKWGDVFRDIPIYAILDEKDSIYLNSSNSKPSLWNVIQSLEAGRVSFPVQVDTLSYVVQVIKKLNPGDPLPLNYATPRIRERMIIEKRRQLYQTLLDSLRSVGNFQIDPSVAIRDTSVQE